MEYINDLPYANACINVVNQMKAEYPDLIEDYAFLGAMKQTLRSLGTLAETLVEECLADNPNMTAIKLKAKHLNTQLKFDRGEI